MSARVIAGLALLAALAVGVVLLDETPSGPAPSTNGDGGGAAPIAGASPWASATSCRACHPQVWDEWYGSMHAAAFTDPQAREQSDGFRQTECLPCHAPRPIFEHGIEEGTRVLARIERRADGVDCLACHRVAEGVAAARTIADAPCRPRLQPELSRHQLCFPCHNQHNTHDEWMASPAAARGESCIDCHMPRVNRSPPEAGAPRAGRSHANWGGRDREFALAGLDVTHEFDPERRRLVVTLHNEFAAHNLPTDSRNRALDLVVTLFDARGLPLPAIDADAREAGQARGTARVRFRNPYRSSGNPNTQLPAGAAHALDLEVPEGVVRAEAELVYKLSPWIEDDAAHWTERWSIPLDD